METDQKHTRRSVRKLRMDWAGTLASLEGRYGSVELQHKILEWRTEDTLAELCAADDAASKESSAE